jgi:signal peptidase I
MTEAQTNQSPAAPARHRRAVKAASTIFLGCCFALAALMLVPALLGYQRYVVTGDSMSGAIAKGSIAYADEVPVSELRPGDVITFTPPGRSSDSYVTHRIVSIRRDREGVPVYRTKGDANDARDPWRFSLRQPTQARVSFHVPFAGYVFGALAIRSVRMLAIGLPALLIAFGIAAALWREAGEGSRRETATPEASAS